MITSTTVYASEENDQFDMVQLSSQGAAAGAFLGFLMPVAAMMSRPENGYNFLYQVYLPIFLFAGILFGALEGILIWGLMEKAGHRLNLLVRAGIGIAGLAIVLVALRFLAQPSPYETKASETGHVFTYAGYAAYVLFLGLVTGSRFEPLRALISGGTAAKYRVLSAITGVTLRVFVIFALMESVLYLTWTGQTLGDEWWMFGVWACIHFIAAAVIAFASLPFRHLATVAVIINLPVVVCIVNAFNDRDQVPLGVIGLVYLALWAAFVLSRLPDRSGEGS